ncbi:WD40-repeat-containing domain protein [Paraphysoderma sedebokerense]|nr:WD40-repeat-containing domain protein [Paraphysoderma sedebokerense]
MNLQLLDPFEHPLPDVQEAIIPDTYARTLKFNRRGNLLAAGCIDGRCIIYDFETKGPALSLCGHVKDVTSVSWSRNGRYLLSSSMDWNCIVWDLATARKKHVIRFESPLMFAQLHPRNDSLLTVCPIGDLPVVVDLTTNNRWTITMPSELDFSAPHSQRDADSHMIACWDRKGERIYVGTPKGHLIVVEYATEEIVYFTKIAGSSIKGISFSRSGRDLVINASDRTVRVFHIPSLVPSPSKSVKSCTSKTAGKSSPIKGEEEPLMEYSPPILMHKLQDLVNKYQWIGACFNCDGECVIAGSVSRAQHSIYIWDKNLGNLVKILEGPKEGLADLCWHPYRPIIASITVEGNIYIWGTSFTENWSAFAPGFKHLEENITYVEREDEFDMKEEPPADELPLKRKREEEEQVEVDVVTIERVNPFSESDSELEYEDDTFVLPVQLSEGDENERLSLWVEGRSLAEETVGGSPKKERSKDASEDKAGAGGEDVKEPKKKKKKRRKKSTISMAGFEKLFLDDFESYGVAGSTDSLVGGASGGLAGAVYGESAGPKKKGRKPKKKTAEAEPAAV